MLIEDEEHGLFEEHVGKTVELESNSAIFGKDNRKDETGEHIVVSGFHFRQDEAKLIKNYL